MSEHMLFRCGEGDREAFIGLYYIDITLFKKPTKQPNNTNPPKTNSRKLIKCMDFDFEQVSSSFLKLVYIRNKLAYVYPCGQFPGIPLRNFAGYDSPS